MSKESINSTPKAICSWAENISIADKAGGSSEELFRIIRAFLTASGILKNVKKIQPDTVPLKNNKTTQKYAAPISATVILPAA